MTSTTETLIKDMIGNAQAALRPNLRPSAVKFFLRQSARCAAELASDG